MTIMTRGDGSTTKQILTAPQDAVYVCPVEQTGYFRDLAKALDRSDLLIESPSVLTDNAIEKLVGSDRAVILDHALRLSPEMDRNLNTLHTPLRKISQEVTEPNLKPESLTADVISWSPNGTGLIIRGAQFEVRCRLKYQPPAEAGGPSEQRARAMSLMERIANAINQKHSETEEANARPSQEATIEIDRDAALKVIVAVLSDPKIASRLKKKYSDVLGPLL